MMLKKTSMGIGQYAPGPATTAYCAVFGWLDSQCGSGSAAAPTGISPGLPAGYDPTTGTVTNTDGSVTVPTLTAQQQALATALNPVIGSDTNVTANNGGAGSSGTPADPCPFGCAIFGIGCPTVCNPAVIDPGSIAVWALGGAAVFFLAKAFLEGHKI